MNIDKTRGIWDLDNSTELEDYTYQIYVNNLIDTIYIKDNGEPMRIYLNQRNIIDTNVNYRNEALNILRKEKLDKLINKINGI